MTEPPTLPNVLLLHWSDLGRHLGTYGVRGVHSPSVDRLAGEGVQFGRAFSAAPLCSPARGALFTGRYPHANGLMGNAHLGWRYGEAERTLPALLADAGYHTALAGLQHEGDDPRALGFAETITDPAARWQHCGEVADAALGWLEGRASWRQPFLLTVGLHEVHRPYPAERYPPEDPAGVDVPGFLPDNPWTRDDLAAFQGAIRVADLQVGRLLDRLDRLGLAPSTWVIFTTDHGTPFPRAKSTLYDPGIEVALIMRLPEGWRAPRNPEGRLFSHVDLVPTILDRFGLPIPEGVHGMSHARWLAGDEAARGRTEIFAEKTYHDVYDPMRCVRTGRWKYIRNYEQRPLLTLPADIEASPTRRGYRDDHLRHRPAEELYDLRDDPFEQENLVGEPSCAEIRGSLAGRLLHFRQETRDPLLLGPVPAPDPR
ncbi:MAG: sulfatase-like hydrolase/transferase [Streptosporangiales bacterium]|nr:sulfatase-like hydrolase/transferase [Streptosporangiales bacterium]